MGVRQPPLKIPLTVMHRDLVSHQDCARVSGKMGRTIDLTLIQKIAMKSLFKSFGLLCLAGLLAIVAGCASGVKQTESMLTAAGFKTQLATTPQQQAHLASLPADQIVPVKRHGVVYFVFADKVHNEIFIGQQAQYRAYNQMVLSQQEEKENLAITRWDAETAQMNESDAMWDNWGVWETFPVYP